MRPKTNSTNYQNILILLIPTFILIVAWIGFTVYGNRVKSTISEGQSKRITPISPTFDFQTITALRSRTQLSPIFTFQAPPSEDSLDLNAPPASDAATTPPLDDQLPLPPEQTIPTSGSAALQTPTTGGTP